MTAICWMAVHSTRRLQTFVETAFARGGRDVDTAGAPEIPETRALDEFATEAASPAGPIPPASNAVPAAPHNEVEELESEGSFIAAALALAVVGYGALLLVSWRDPLPRVSASSVAPRVNMAAGAAAPETAQGALNSLRHQTLAFHRCNMTMTGVDQAVARCDGSSRAYTIDFRRTSGRWMIQRVSSR